MANCWPPPHASNPRAWSGSAATTSGSAAFAASCSGSRSATALAVPAAAAIAARILSLGRVFSSVNASSRWPAQATGLKLDAKQVRRLASSSVLLISAFATLSVLEPGRMAPTVAAPSDLQTCPDAGDAASSASALASTSGEVGEASGSGSRRNVLSSTASAEHASADGSSALAREPKEPPENTPRSVSPIIVVSNQPPSRSGTSPMSRPLAAAAGAVTAVVDKPGADKAPGLSCPESPTQRQAATLPLT